MKERSDEIQRRAAALRAKRKRAELNRDLHRLLGPTASADLVVEGPEAASALSEFRSNYEAVEGVPSLLMHREWQDDEQQEIADLLHRLSTNLGPRPCWLLLSAPNPLRLSVNLDDVLDNPFGFAALESHQLRLVDRKLPAALWLTRHSYHGPSDVTYAWELEVWGEPWWSAANRALGDAP